MLDKIIKYFTPAAYEDQETAENTIAFISMLSLIAWILVIIYYRYLDQPGSDLLDYLIYWFVGPFMVAALLWPVLIIIWIFKFFKYLFKRGQK